MTSCWRRTRMRSVALAAAGSAVLLAPGLFGAVCVFTQPATFAIPPADTGSSTLAVAGVVGPVSDVEVRLNGIRETTFGLFELDVLLVSPRGAEIILLSFACRNKGPVDLRFSRSATTVLPDSQPFSPACASATYLPGDYAPNNNAYILKAPPAPKAPYPDDLDDLVGADPNGTWTLWAAADGADDLGSITSWQLLVTAAACPAVPLFADGFESGDTCAWSARVGGVDCL